MTVTPPSRAAHRWRARAAAVAAALALAFGALTTPTAAAAPNPQPTPEPGIVAATLAPIAGGIVRPGEALTVSVTVQNGTDTPTAASTTTVSLGTTHLASRAALAAWLDGDTAGVTVQPVGSGTIEAVDAQGTVTTGIRVELAEFAPGVYPLLATVDGLGLVSTSVMTVPDGAASTGIGVIVPITAGPMTAGLLTAAQLATLTAPDGALTNELDAVDGTAAILAIDPAIPAAIRVLGSSAPASARAWLERLESLPHTRFALQFGDADVAAQLDGGLAAPLSPTSLGYAMDPTDFAPSAQPSAAPTPETPSPTPGQTGESEDAEPALPDLAELLAIGPARPDVLWPDPTAVSASLLTGLGALVTTGDASLTLVPSTSTVAGGSGATVAASGTTGDARALVYDAAISRALHAASLREDTALRGAPLAEATAHLALAAAENPGSPLLVTLDRGTDRSRVGLRSALLTALQAPGAVPLSLTGLAEAPPVPVQLAAQTVSDEERGAAASRLVREEEHLGRFATILDDPTLLTGPERAEILQLLGVAWTATPDEWRTAVTEHHLDAAATLDSVGILSFGDIQQIGPSANIPVWVRNDLPFDARVVLDATPDDLRLDVAPSTELVARAQSNTQILLPVNAQIGSGEVTITLQLRSGTNEQIGSPELAQVTVRADWERYGVIALALIVTGLLVVGVIRTVRRRRAARREDAAEPRTAESEDHS